ncbi:hypothetical protein SAMN02745164_00322 [Marinitoga hydrogenitolerans DSM 16785]|uniref:Uncharacterized protein n=1 Tax=Marinitoga hydrogenitolerans (strain DSM 16785 / JCM 12826 / AT1271) TaxID=1122195 RepID=A0A1M4T091_MARH1|nr:hypothetical protein [Marinitoga hydrogenitolerans]SHE37908.1 hypothetical protein SAMN02745164_00322 [Marinitoga hydrogenitolerans DSM 16785]
MFDILIKNAKLRNYKKLKDIGIKDGCIIKISDKLTTNLTLEMKRI